jgi:hypothetical protein
MRDRNVVLRIAYCDISSSLSSPRKPCEHSKGLLEGSLTQSYSIVVRKRESNNRSYIIHYDSRGLNSA